MHNTLPTPPHRIFLCSLFLTLASSIAWAADVKPPCADPAFRAFDFWAGTWDVYDVGGQTKVASARIDPILDGCVLREDYQQFDGHQGQSFTMYDATRHVWHQSWVTNRGELLQIEGTVQDGSIVLSGEDRDAGTLVRGIWKPEHGNVRETADTSADQGKTWKPWFDIIFRPASDPAGDSSRSKNAETVKELDRRYQQAVKDNDVAMMDAMLADDFMLVTGTGKSYSKADLLAEARSGRIHYDRQDDSDQTVRSWGDTAVITAKLTAKGVDSGKPFEYQVWFSDTYAKTATGWKYVFGQSSTHLSQTPR
jgi:ketosteroid isomerase-like protein